MYGINAINPVFIYRFSWYVKLCYLLVAKFRETEHDMTLQCKEVVIETSGKWFQKEGCTRQNILPIKSRPCAGHYSNHSNKLWHIYEILGPARGCHFLERWAIIRDYYKSMFRGVFWRTLRTRAAPCWARRWRPRPAPAPPAAGAAATCPPRPAAPATCCPRPPSLTHHCTTPTHLESEKTHLTF